MGGSGLVIHPAWRSLGKYSRDDSDTDRVTDHICWETLGLNIVKYAPFCFRVTTIGFDCTTQHNHETL